MTSPTGFDCERARRGIHRRLDAEPLEPAFEAWLAGHLAQCAGCRRFGAELQQIQDALRGLDRLELPASALQEVWDRTRDAGTRPAKAWRRVALTAAAVLVLAVAGLWLWTARRDVEPRPFIAQAPSEEELRQAAEQARMVLGLTARALRRTEQAAIHDVLGGDVSDALQRVPIQWPPARTRESEL